MVFTLFFFCFVCLFHSIAGPVDNRGSDTEPRLATLKKDELLNLNALPIAMAAAATTVAAAVAS